MTLELRVISLATFALAVGAFAHAAEAPGTAVAPATAVAPVHAEATAGDMPHQAPVPAAHADTPGADARVIIAGKIPGTKPEDVHPSAIPGVFELMRGTQAAYVSGDGKYAIVGDMYDLGANANMTEDRRRDVRLKMLAAVPESQMVIFGPADARHTITVFTDVDCAYCRKLHSQIATYNQLGIRVRYVFYPRTGPNTESWTKAEQVWCSADRKDALTRAKRGEALKDKPCADNPVAREYELGRKFDLQGTPAIVLANGDMLPGYVPPAELAQELKSLNR